MVADWVEVAYLPVSVDSGNITFRGAKALSDYGFSAGPGSLGDTVRKPLFWGATCLTALFELETSVEIHRRFQCSFNLPQDFRREGADFLDEFRPFQSRHLMANRKARL